MKIARRELLNKLELCKLALDNRVLYVEGSDTYLAEDGKLFAYNDRELMALPFLDGLSFCVKANDFHKVVAKLSEDEVDIEVKNEKVVLKSGKTRSTISQVINNLYAFITGVYDDATMDWQDLPKDFLVALHTVHIADMSNSRIAGVYLTSNKMTNSDGKYVASIGLSSNYESFWFSPSAIAGLSKLENVEKFCFQMDWMFFKTTDGTVFACRSLNQKSYPIDKIDKAVETIQKCEGDIGSFTIPESLNIFDVIERLKLFAIEDGHMHVASVSLSADQIVFSSQNNRGDNIDIIECSSEIKEPLAFIFPIRLFESGLEHTRDFTIQEYSAKSYIALFRKNNWKLFFLTEKL